VVASDTGVAEVSFDNRRRKMTKEKKSKTNQMMGTSLKCNL